MIVSWNWLQQYVRLDMSPAELEHRLAMTGLNHEGSEQVGEDLAVDLEVTSNRPDCLGHIGVAREVSVLWRTPLKIPPVDQLPESDESADSLVGVSVESPQLCPQYTARVIKGVRVGPSPDWLVQRLAAVGQASVNNIVDITNYVLLESGQPLHAFDYAQLAGPQIVVRRAREGEQLEAINHETYLLDSEMCVIADAERAVAIAGIMGGAESEVGAKTTDVLIESAEFNQLATRNASRKLKLPSDSSYRFERGVDPQGVDWASRRCCQLILELAGGTLAKGVARAGSPAEPPDPVTLRLSQLKRLLGIEIPGEEAARIIAALGFDLLQSPDDRITCRAPSWRRDCTREADLIEEVARIHGYEEIPEDTRVPMAVSAKAPFDVMLDRARQVLVGAGCYEAMTVTVTSARWNRACNPWGSQARISSEPSMLRGADQLRQSIVPSLLNARKYNDSRGNLDAELFETAKVFVADKSGAVEEPRMLAVVSSRDYLHLKGVLETLADRMGCQAAAGEGEPPPLLAPGRSSWLSIEGRPWGYVGELSDEGLKQFGLQRGATVAEVRLETLAEHSELIPQDKAISPHPAMSQDLNFVVPEQLSWRELESAVRSAAAGVATPLLSAAQVLDWKGLQQLLAAEAGVGAHLRGRLARDTQSEVLDDTSWDDRRRAAVVEGVNAMIHDAEPLFDAEAFRDVKVSDVVRSLLDRRRLSAAARARLHRRLIEEAAGTDVIAEQNCAQLESVAYKETYVDARQDGPGRKRLLLTIVLRSLISTLTGKQAEEVREAIIAELKKLDAKLLG